MSISNQIFTSFYKLIKLSTVCLITICLYITLSSKTTYANDLYNSMTELMNDTEEGVDWEITNKVNQSNTLIAAIHGGNIEPGTTEVANITATNGAYNYYTFQGIRPTDNQSLHVTSVNFDEPIIEEMQQQVSNSVMIHGAAGDQPIVYIGGKDDDLKASIEKQLELKDFDVQTSPTHLEGEADQNIVNRNNQDAGVQLELTTGLRQSFFNNQDLTMNSRQNQSNWSFRMYDFAQAIRIAIHDHE
ncbi:MAG TPA: poly-gamma-glutamate hydrolase family protein [Staphylococcus sp.]|nr:poly-gamma-glutamate hydrolase family protein [Staphylococcus sp.]